VGHTSPSVRGRPGQRSACRAMVSPTRRGLIRLRTELDREQWGSWLLGLAVLIVIMRGSWLLGLAVLIAIMMHGALTSDLPAPKLLAVAGTLPSPSQRAEHVQLLGDASDWGNGAPRASGQRSARPHQA